MVFSADAFFSMDPFSFRSSESSLRLTAEMVQTRLMAYTVRRQSDLDHLGG